MSVDVDPVLLEQALINVLENAAALSPHGSTIWADIWPEEGHVAMSVTDEGSAIRPDDLPHVFDKLFRGKSDRRGREGSVGLSLSVARGLVEAFGGAISAESSVQAQRHSQAAERTAKKDLALSNPCGEVRRVCCGDQLNPPRNADYRSAGRASAALPSARLNAGCQPRSFERRPPYFAGFPIGFPIAAGLGNLIFARKAPPTGLRKGLAVTIPSGDRGQNVRAVPMRPAWWCSQR